MPAALQTAEVVDFQEYRRRRGDAETTAPVAPMPIPAEFAFFWVPVIVFMPVWRLG